ncbi:lymphocyte antigen 6K [Monodelphis domestica]|uniref:lymphocyte antigen 6K n=1 Tax=Monodelphis domestica TaxID=13616 RepID=UPI0024E213F3|nr:lymphocyte antigen 6K [Monodelphis domestica]
MKTLLCIIMFATLLCTDCAQDTEEIPLSTASPSGPNLLQCHVCRGTFQCQSPKYCAPEENFCLIVEIAENYRRRVLKYCSVNCPHMEDFHGREASPLYLACCAYNLCNFRKLIEGSGSRVCTSVLVVAMAFVASFLGALKIGL